MSPFDSPPRTDSDRRPIEEPIRGPIPIRSWLGAILLVSSLCMAFPDAARSQETPQAEQTESADERPSALAQFTTAIEDREPVDQVTFVPTDVRKIFFFSELRGLAGQTVAHRWIHDGETMAEVRFEVRGPRWRIWSSKELLPDWIGDWTVEIVTAEGEVLAAETFTYSPPPDA